MEKRTEDIKRQAAADIERVLENIRDIQRRRRWYRYGLGAAMLLSLIVFLATGFFYLYSSVPSVIRLKSGMEQSFDLNLKLPMTAEVSVEGSGKSKTKDASLTIPLYSPVTLMPGSAQRYSMDVKLFGVIPVKKVGVQVVEEQKLIPVGVPVGIYVETEGLLVVDVGSFESQNGTEAEPAKDILRAGDYITALNGQPMTDKNQFTRAVENCGGEPIRLMVRREEQAFQVALQPVKNRMGDYRIGVWIRDNAQGVGTMTYVDEQGNFGALGHGINDIDTSTLMNMQDGTLYRTQIVEIAKGEKGKPGEMTGMIIYSPDQIIGRIRTNTEQGIYGRCSEAFLVQNAADALPIGLKQEIKKGPAQILCTVEKEPEYFDVEITKVHMAGDNVNRGIELKVTDPQLLAITGGIIQGMSGSPILQDGKIVGAVTHVLVNDPTRGYGIFIEEMMK